MKITKTTVTTVELDYADVHATLKDFNNEMLADMVRYFTVGPSRDRRLLPSTVITLAQACLKGEDSPEFRDLLEKTSVMWINTPAELFGYVELIEQFPCMFLPRELLEQTKDPRDLKIWVGGYQVNTATVLDNF